MDCQRCNRKNNPRLVQRVDKQTATEVWVCRKCKHKFPKNTLESV